MAGGPKRLDLVGQRFGMLLVVEKMPTDNISTKFLCKCDCGNEKVVVGSELNRGNWKSCGCNRTPRTTFQYRDHPLYDVWKGMKARCRDKKHRGYSIYGGAGVKVCELWQNDFISFYNWSIKNGYKEGLQLDKDIIPKKLGIPALLYSPEMCSWVTAAENSHAKDVLKLNDNIIKEIRASNLKRVELSKKYGVNVSTIDRVKNHKIWK